LDTIKVDIVDGISKQFVINVLPCWRFELASIQAAKCSIS